MSTATSTDIAVDIAVDTTYSKHDPCQVPLYCNFMGYIFAINEISGDEIKFALKWFWSKITICA